MKYCYTSIYFKKVFLVLTILIVGGFVTEAYSQGDSSLRLVIISESDGLPVFGANIQLLEFDEDPESAEVLKMGVSDMDGFVEFSNLTAGMYMVQVSYVGHESHLEQLELEENERKVERVYLEFTEQEFDEVVVEGQRGIAVGEVGVRRISPDVIRNIPTPGAGGDLTSFIQTLPGVVTSGDRGGDLYIRGGTPTQNLILVDNIQVIKPFHISNMYSAFPTDIIQNVDLYAGGFSADYVGATSAVMDVTLRPGNMRNHQANVSISPYLSGIHVEGPFTEDESSFLINGRFSTMEQTAPLLTGEEIPINFYDVTSRVTLSGDELSCNFTGIRTYDRGQINPNRNVDLEWSNTLGGARCLWFDTRLNNPIDVTVGFMNYSNSESSPNQTEANSSIRDIFFRFDHSEELFGQLVDYGFGTKFRYYDTELAERFADFRSFDAVRALIHAYASVEFNPTESIYIQPSLGTQITIQSPPTFEPRLRTSYRFGNRQSQELSFTVGRYYQAMGGINDERDAGTVFTVLIPNQDGERLPGSTHVIAGYENRFGPFTANLETYYKYHSNVPVSKWTPMARIEVETVDANGTGYGFDTRLEFDRNRLFAYIGYGYSVVEYEAVSGDLGAWVEEPVFKYNPAHDQRHKLNTVFSYRFGKFVINIAWEFSTGMPYTRVFGFDLALQLPQEHPMVYAGSARTLFAQPYGERLPAHHKLDVSLSRSFDLSQTVSMEIEAGVMNLYDRNNIFYFDLNSLQRVDQDPFMPYISFKANIN